MFTMLRFSKLSDDQIDEIRANSGSTTKYGSVSELRTQLLGPRAVLQYYTRQIGAHGDL